MKPTKALQKILQNPYNFLLGSFAIYFIFAFIANSPKEIFNGIISIYTTPDILISDYIEIGGLGAALTNSAFVGILGTLLMKHCGCKFKGSNIMAIWLMCGFAFFGKTVINILPIILGGYLYCLFQKIEFSENLITILLATTLGPIVTQMSYIGIESSFLAILLGVFLGMLVGFVIIPVAKQTRKAHDGYNLYNVGFAGGIIAIIFTAIIRNMGIQIETLSLWSEGNNTYLFLFLLTLCLYLVLGGSFASHYSFREYFNIKLFIAEDSTTHDYYQSVGEQSYQNMATVGLLAGLLVILTGGQLNGPLLGGIFTIIGFAACGKNLLNMLPVVLGCAIAAFINGWDIKSPGIMLAILFSTTLSPIPNKFGIFWGLVAGFLHVNAVARLSELHGGLSLYNNGLAGGLVATMLVPIIKAFRESPRVPKKIKEKRELRKEKLKQIVENNKPKQ